MNSLNHYAYGSIAEFMYAHILGIRPAAPGFTSAVIQPVLNFRLREAKGAYESVSGIYEVHWRIEDSGLVTVNIKIPFSCEAEVILPRYSGGRKKLPAGSYSFSYEPDEDYRCIYSKDTLFRYFSEDTRVMDIIREYLPPVFGMIMSGGSENLSLCLGDLYDMPFLGLGREELDKAAARIKSIKGLWE
jgi:alpha-L-rhamnosidase